MPNKIKSFYTKTNMKVNKKLIIDPIIEKYCNIIKKELNEKNIFMDVMIIIKAK